MFRPFVDHPRRRIVDVGGQRGPQPVGNGGIDNWLGQEAGGGIAHGWLRSTTRGGPSTGTRRLAGRLAASGEHLLDEFLDGQGFSECGNRVRLAAEHLRQFAELTGIGIRSEFGAVGAE